MKTDFPCLLKPGKIGRMELKNRVVSAPMGTQNADTHGFVTQTVIDYYVEEAKGGLGRIVAEGTYIDDILSKAEFNGLGIQTDEHTNGWARLVTAVHDWDCSQPVFVIAWFLLPMNTYAQNFPVYSKLKKGKKRLILV